MTQYQLTTATNRSHQNWTTITGGATFLFPFAGNEEDLPKKVYFFLFWAKMVGLWVVVCGVGCCVVAVFRVVAGGCVCVRVFAAVFCVLVVGAEVPRGGEHFLKQSSLLLLLLHR
jgi:hypothetical protein